MSSNDSKTLYCSRTQIWASGIRGYETTGETHACFKAGVSRSFKLPHSLCFGNALSDSSLSVLGPPLHPSFRAALYFLLPPTGIASAPPLVCLVYYRFCGDSSVFYLGANKEERENGQLSSSRCSDVFERGNHLERRAKLVSRTGRKNTTKVKMQSVVCTTHTYAAQSTS